MFDDAFQREAIARICERHTGAGLSPDDISLQQLPIVTHRSLLPETLEEQLVCLADKFFSKSGDAASEKDFVRIKQSMMKFGSGTMSRFESMCRLFYMNF